MEAGYRLALEAFKPLNQELYAMLDYYGYSFRRFRDDDGNEV